MFINFPSWKAHQQYYQQYHFTSWSHQLCHLLQAVDKFRVSQIQSPPYCQSLLQINSVTTLHSYPIGLHSNLTILTRPQLYLLAEENSDLLNAPNMRTVLHKHSQSHFTICLQIFHQSMLLQVMLKKKHIWKHNTCYTDEIPHGFFMLYLPFHFISLKIL